MLRTVARIVPEAKEFQEHFKISAIFDQVLFTPIKTTKKLLLSVHSNKEILFSRVGHILKLT